MSSRVMQLRQVLETCLYVDDLEAAEHFYRDSLGLDLISRETGRHAFFRCGDGVFLLFHPDQTSVPSGEIPIHGAYGPGHAAFGVNEAELAGWRKQLERLGVEIEKEITWPNGGRSIYFRDPSGNSLEFATPKIWGLPEDSTEE